MHLVIPFAAPLSEAGRATQRGLRWPVLQRLLAGRVAQRDEGDELSLSPPHERALARAWGWSGADGQLPFAAHAARGDGLDPGDLAWGLLTPVHWHLGTDQLSMTDPQALALDETSSRALFDAVAPLFTSEGFVVRWGAPLRWYLAHESLAGLALASPDRVIGRNVDRWLPAGREARLWRRLQNEVQMLLYAHPINEAREARGALAVNSFWLSGCGRWQESLAEPVQIDERLRAPLLGEDWAAWAEAWRALDAGPLATLASAAERGEPVALTLAGERFAQRFENAGGSWWARLRQRFNHPSAADVLEAL